MKFSLKKEMQFKKAAETFLCVWAYAELIHFICLLCVRLLVLYECVWFKTCASHKRPTWLFLFHPPPRPPLFPLPSVANELASQESKMWFSGGRILAGGVRTVLARCPTIAICPSPMSPNHKDFRKFSFLFCYFEYNEVRSGSHKNHMFSHIKILFKMNTWYLAGII